MNEYTKGLLQNHITILDREIEEIEQELDRSRKYAVSRENYLVKLKTKRAAVAESVA